MSAVLTLDTPEASLPMAYGRVMTADEFSRWPGDGFHHRHALIDGEPVAMNPPSFRHGAIISRLITFLGPHLRATRPDCEIGLDAGVQPHSAAATNVRIPDLVVACGPQRQHYAQGPLVIVEVLSPSNAAETREVVRACLSIPTLREVLILDSLACRGELHRRDPDGAWPDSPMLIGEDGEIVLASLDFRCPLADVYPDR